jgi:NADH-quinone oxidoreductase subunit L
LLTAAVTLFLLPILAFTILILLGRRLGNWSALLSVGAMAGGLALSLYITSHVMAGERLEFSFPWLPIGEKGITMGILIDPVSALMLCLVTFVSMMTQTYSLKYMEGDPRYTRYFAYKSLFSASMLGVVLVNNLLGLYIFLELVGLTSYLLVGFWFEKRSAYLAMNKALITTRIGDVGLLLGILVLFISVGSFDYEAIRQAVADGTLTQGTITLASLLLLVGVMGKSAQFPMHTWLPDAMEGPTPVSALLHAATMVAAGVYLLIRVPYLTQASPEASIIIAVIGGFTAFLAASMGMVMTDIKHVLAYSTVSQLGYMVMAAGLGAPFLALFHLMTHAFFKALLFLSVGSAIHGTEKQDLREMGGLMRKMPLTGAMFLIGALALSGVPPLAGFWSKEAILGRAFEIGNMPLFALGVLVTFMTTFYMFRVYFSVFTGKPRDQEAYDHAHESPAVMLGPMVLLSFFSIVAGFLGSSAMGHAYYRFMGIAPAESHEGGEIVMTLSIAAVAVGLFLAWVIYGKQWISSETIRRKARAVHTLVWNKYWLDDLYNRIVVDGGLAFSRFMQGVDNVVDWVVNGVGLTTQGAGQGLRQTQTGLLQNYMLAIVLGIVLIVIGIGLKF